MVKNFILGITLMISIGVMLYALTLQIQADKVADDARKELSKCMKENDQLQKEIESLKLNKQDLENLVDQ